VHPPTHDIAEDVAQLRAEVKKLSSVLDRHMKLAGCMEENQGALNSRPSASSTDDPDPPSANISRAGEPQDVVESAMTDLEVSIAGPYAGSRPDVTSATGTTTSEIYSGSLSGLEPGSLAGRWLLDTWFNGQVHRGWPVCSAWLWSDDC
jgi:hypothetical protein